MTEEELRAEAVDRQQSIQQQLDAVSESPRLSHFQNAGCFTIWAFVSLLVPIIGPLLFVIFILMALAFLVYTVLGTPIKHGNEELTIQAMMNNLRGKLKGNCPVCNSEIILSPQGGPFEAHCPSCKSLLFYQSGYVTRR